MNGPDEHVAEAIVAELRRLGLLSDPTLEKLKPRLQAGSFSAADWKLLFETERPRSGGAR